MQPVVAITLYSMILIGFIITHQLLFKFNFKQMSFNLLFLIFSLVMFIIADKANKAVGGMLIATLIITFCYFIFVTIMLRKARDNWTKQVQSVSEIEEMYKYLISNVNIPNVDEEENGGNQDIIATEVENEEKGDKKKINFDVGNVIIDNDEKKEGGNEDE